MKNGRAIATQVINYDLGRAVDHFIGKRNIRIPLTSPAK
ncbi:MAG: hypothetical protein FD145_1186 [Candidatus Saganbacteria bacterium]|uniref:Uncharacterized protein n=1 Tax=Candidatus Saganbacteria bacterium TaxID=2575572 RepID=A0A833L0C7_UNCSA|nr:MAG: hypothetical protein FD145_1186 [Candidatus Saganbacteria bacterium]